MACVVLWWCLGRWISCVGSGHGMVEHTSFCFFCARDGLGEMLVALTGVLPFFLLELSKCLGTVNGVAVINRHSPGVPISFESRLARCNT